MKQVLIVLIMSFIGVSKSFFTPSNFPKVNLKFIHGYGTLNRSRYNVHNATQLMQNKNFNGKSSTILFISGWTQSPDAEASQLLIKAYLKRGDYNILVLDWSDYSVGLYSAVMIRISKISRIYGRVLLRLFDKGLDSKSLHCIGHSFGAHSCGIMGRELFQASNRKYKLARITRLDPAAPYFFPATYEQPLNPEDALFVDAIHSDVFFIGTKFPVGHVDFYPNYNMVQPGCPPFKLDSLFNFLNSMCSHFNAVRYWVDSLISKDGKFASRQCQSWEDYEKGSCRDNTVNYMGVNANPRLRGKFFLKLSSKKFYDGKSFYNWFLRRIEQRAINLINFNI